MSIVGFTDQQKQDLFALLAGILYLADVEFSGEESAHISSSAEILNTACSLLGVELSTMELALTTLVTITRGEEVIREYKIEQADDCRDAAAKAIYGRAFSWIVSQVRTQPMSCLMVLMSAILLGQCASCQQQAKALHEGSKDFVPRYLRI